MKALGRKWTQSHAYASVFLISMLLSPYASNQGMIVPLGFAGSWPAVVSQYFALGVTSQFGVFREYSAWWALLLGTAALWFYIPALENRGAKPATSEAVAHEGVSIDGT